MRIFFSEVRTTGTDLKDIYRRESWKGSFSHVLFLTPVLDMDRLLRISFLCMFLQILLTAKATY